MCHAKCQRPITIGCPLRCETLGERKYVGGCLCPCASNCTSRAPNLARAPRAESVHKKGTASATNSICCSTKPRTLPPLPRMMPGAAASCRRIQSNISEVRRTRQRGGPLEKLYGLFSIDMGPAQCAKVVSSALPTPAPSSPTAEEKTGHRSLVIRSLVCWVLELANTCAAPKQAGAVPAFWTRSRLKIIRRGSICCVHFVIAAGCHSVAEYPCVCRPLRASDAAEKVDQLGVQEHAFREGCSSSTPVVCASKRLFLGKSRKGLASLVSES